MMENLRQLFRGKESKKEEAAEKKLPAKTYAKGEKMEEAAMKKPAAKKSTVAKATTKKGKK
jgi:hypothetical protein